MKEENRDDLNGVRQKGLEKLILLVLGGSDNEISILHLEKEMFLLHNFHPDIKQYFNFIKHYRGPFSKAIQESVFYPIYLENHWRYIKPKTEDRVSGGYIQLTDVGKKEYENTFEKIREDARFEHLITGIKMVRELYDKLTVDELLLLIYDTYPKYIKKSEIYGNIKKKRADLSLGLLKKGVIDENRQKMLMVGLK